MLTPKHIEIVQDSFALVVPRAAVVAKMFYDRLFEQNPELREMFAEDMEEQRGKLVVTLATVVQSLHSLEDVIGDVRALGQRHVGYRVEDAHYDHVGAALLWTLENGLGDAWNDELKEAWTKAYTVLATEMKEAAAQVKAA